MVYKNCVMVTNNYKCYDEWCDSKFMKVEFDPDWDYRDVLVAARNYIHRGYHLLTHPMCGSVKPNQTPFKSIILSTITLESAEEFKDLMLIESSIATYDKFIANHPLPRWTEKSVNDYRTIDLSLMDGAVSNSIMRR